MVLATFGVLVCVALLAVMAGVGHAHYIYVRMKDRKEVRFEDVIKDLKGVRVVYIGETHDVREHHDIQFQVIRGLRRAGVPLALGLEMFTASSQRELDRWLDGKMGRKRFEELFYRDWQQSWSLYREILLFARKNRIPLVGLNVPREITRKVAREGVDALTKEERRLLPPNISCEVDADYMAMIRRAYAEHGGNDNSFRHFCEAQMLWNKSMAFHLLAYLRKNPQRTVVVLAGGGHALKQGVPEQVRKELQVASRVVLPEAVTRPGEVTAEDADYLVLWNH